MEGGGDPLIPTDTKTTPLMLAAGAGTDVVRPRGAKERTTAIQTVKYLMEHGAVVNDAGQFGWTPLPMPLPIRALTMSSSISLPEGQTSTLRIVMVRRP